MIISAHEAARILGVTRDKLWKHVRYGDIPITTPPDEPHDQAGRPYVYGFDSRVIRALVGKLADHRRRTSDADRSLVIRVTPKERAMWDAKACPANASLSIWIRAQCNAHLETRLTLAGMEGPGSQARAIEIRASSADLRRWARRASDLECSRERWIRAVCNRAASAK